MLLVVLGVGEDGQKVLLAAQSMGGEIFRLCQGEDCGVRIRDRLKTVANLAWNREIACVAVPPATDG